MELSEESKDNEPQMPQETSLPTPPRSPAEGEDDDGGLILVSVCVWGGAKLTRTIIMGSLAMALSFYLPCYIGKKAQNDMC